MVVMVTRGIGAIRVGIMVGIMMVMPTICLLKENKFALFVKD